MCVAIPMCVMEIQEGCALVEAAGIKKRVQLALLKEVKIGEYVMVHAGFAIERIHEEEAMKTLELVKELVRL